MSSDRELVTVVIPTHNRPDRLMRCLHSVVAQRQDYSSLEIVVVDDGLEQDGDWDMRRRVVEVGVRSDCEIRVVRTAGEEGPSAARMLGADAGIGVWIAFVDDDDVWASGKLDRQLEQMRRDDADWCACGVVVVDEAGDVINAISAPPVSEVWPGILARSVVPNPASTVLVRRSAFDQAGGFDRSVNEFEDWLWCIGLAKLGKYSYVEAALVAVESHLGGRSNSLERIVDGFAGLDSWDMERVRNGIELDRSYIYRYLAVKALSKGEREVGERLFREAWRLHHGIGEFAWYAAARYAPWVLDWRKDVARRRARQAPRIEGRWW